MPVFLFRAVLFEKLRLHLATNTMTRSSVFRFKQFSIQQEKSAMKIGTDGVLLGAWATGDSPRSILDIGSGTGLIALMLAQRFPNALIHAVEIDQNAYLEAQLNVKNSVFQDRIKVHHADFKTYKTDTKYDLIVSNPPYFHQSLKSLHDNRNLARHTDSLSLRELLVRAEQMLSNHGVLALILPNEQERDAVSIGEEIGLRPREIVHVKGRVELPVKRCMIALDRSSAEVEKGELVVEVERHKYTAEYVDLTKDFYLHM